MGIGEHDHRSDIADANPLALQEPNEHTVCMVAAKKQQITAPPRRTQAKQQQQTGVSERAVQTASTHLSFAFFSVQLTVVGMLITRGKRKKSSEKQTKTAHTGASAKRTTAE